MSSKDAADGSASSKICESANPSVETLFVVEQIRRMRGGSQSHLMRCRGDAYYVVKFQGNPQGTRILVNEMLGTMLAARMGLPTTPVAVCYVSEKLIELTEDLCVETSHQRIPCRPGRQFGSRFPLDPHRVTVFDFLPDKQLRGPTNFSAFLGMLVFDKWTCNTDGRQTIFYPTEVGGPFYLSAVGDPYQCVIGGPYKTEMIDQGFCFNGKEWNFPDAPLRGLYARYAVYESVRGLDDFEPWIASLELEITESVLMDIAKAIPPEWYDGDWDCLQRLLERLYLRRSKVRELLWDAWETRPYAFPNWTKGISHVA